jgi:hypothetical protein
MRELNRLELDTRSIKLISEHPTGSYSIEREGKKISALVIEDPKTFWSISKILVIMID